MNYYKRPFWKNTSFYILLIILLIGIGFVYWSISRPVIESTKKDSTQKEQILIKKDITPILTYKEGKIRILETDSNEIKKIDTFEKIKSGDTIKTYDDSKTTISFGDSAIVRLDENTEIKINKLENNLIELEQLNGQAYHRSLSDEIEYSVSLKNMKLDASEENLFNVKVNNNEIIVDVLKNSITTQISKDNIPLASYAIEQKFNTVINTEESYDNQNEFNEIDTEKLLEKSWFKWNYDQDISEELDVGILNDDMQIPDEIILNGYIKNKVVHLDWKLEEGKAPNGFRVLMSDEKDPTYPESQNHYISNPEAQSDTWKNLDNAKYHFRVGIYDGKSKILKYSNNVTIIVSDSNDGIIDLQAQTNENNIEFNWTTTNLPEHDGYYILISETGNPVYPIHTNKQVSKDINNYTWKNLDTNKTYHARICAIINDNCMYYSNDVSIDFEKRNGNISLSGNRIDNSVELNWNAQNLETNTGYRILSSKTSDPSLETSTIKTIDSSSISSYIWTNLERNKTYYFEVCEYIGDNKCGVFSNTVSVTIPEENTESQEGSINLTGYFTWGKIHTNWTTNGLNDVDGFYIILSENPSPTYPSNKYHSLDSKATYDAWTVEQGKTYYLRACAQKAGTCVQYSNELTVETGN